MRWLRILLFALTSLAALAVAALAPLENGRTALNAVALTDFGKPLTEITPEQSASLMVMLGCDHGNLATEARKFLKTYQASRFP